MDVKPPNNQVAASVPAPYQRPVQVLQRGSPPISAVLPEDVIDCVEIQWGGAPSANEQTMGYRPLDHPRKEKGTFIDIWI